MELQVIESVEAIRADREPIASTRDCLGTMRVYQAVYDAVLEKQDGLIGLS